MALDETFEVEKIVRERKRPKSGKSEYLVRWKGYADKDDTWEPEEHLRECKDLIEDFKKSKANKTPKKSVKSPAGSGESQQLLTPRTTRFSKLKAEISSTPRTSTNAKIKHLTVPVRRLTSKTASPSAPEPDKNVQEKIAFPSHQQHITGPGIVLIAVLVIIGISSLVLYLWQRQ